MTHNLAYFECGGQPRQGRLWQLLWQLRWRLWYWLARLCQPRFAKVMVLRTADQLTPDIDSAEALERIVSRSKGGMTLVEPFDRYAKGPWREMSFEANRLAVDFLDDYVAKQVPDKLQQFLDKYLGKTGGVKYLKKCLHPYVSLKILFLKQVAFLDSAGLSPQVIFLKDRDPLRIVAWVGGPDLTYRCPWIFRKALAIKDWLILLLPLFQLAGVFMAHVARVRFKTVPSSADITVPIASGFPKSQAWPDDRKPNSGDDVFQCETGTGGLTYLYLFTTWQFPDEFKRRWRAYMERQPNAVVRDAQDFRHDLLGFMANLCPLLLRAIGLVLHAASSIDRLLVTILIPKFVNAYAREYLMARNIATKVYISRDDYAEMHIIRTAILNRVGARNVALMHSALVPAKYWATLCYVHCDAYLINSNAYRSLYAPHWAEAENLIPVGNWRTDLIKRCENDPRVRDRFRAKYGEGFFILALVQDENPLSFGPERLRELYAGILETLKVSDEIKVILRPRRNVFEGVSELRKAREEGRAFVELTDFTTHELQAMCDIMVAGTASSSGLVEMLSVGKPGVGFNIHGWSETVLSKYSSWLVAETSEDIVQFVAHVYRCDGVGTEILQAVESFRRDYCALDDGQALARMGEVLRAYCGLEDNRCGSQGLVLSKSCLKAETQL